MSLSLDAVAAARRKHPPLALQGACGLARRHGEAGQGMATDVMGVPEMKDREEKKHFEISRFGSHIVGSCRLRGRVRGVGQIGSVRNRRKTYITIFSSLLYYYHIFYFKLHPANSIIYIAKRYFR